MMHWNLANYRTERYKISQQNDVVVWTPWFGHQEYLFRIPIGKNYNTINIRQIASTTLSQNCKFEALPFVNSELTHLLQKEVFTVAAVIWNRSCYVSQQPNEERRSPVVIFWAWHLLAIRSVSSTKELYLLKKKLIDSKNYDHSLVWTHNPDLLY